MQQRSSRFNQQERGGSSSRRGGFGGSSSGDKFCKLCKASGSNNFRSHDISECWLLSEKDRSNILKASAKAQAMFACEEEAADQNAYDEGQESYEEENEDDEYYD